MNRIARGLAMAAFGLVLSGTAAHANTVVVNVTEAPAQVDPSYDYYYGTVTFAQPVYIDNNEQVVFEWTFPALPFSKYQEGTIYLTDPGPMVSVGSSLGDFALYYNGYVVFDPAAGEVIFYGRTASDGAGKLPNPSGAPDRVAITGFTYAFGDVPEPGAWLLMMTGVALVGGVLRWKPNLGLHLRRSDQYGAE